jgi:hypothetical protein
VIRSPARQRRPRARRLRRVVLAALAGAALPILVVRVLSIAADGRQLDVPGGYPDLAAAIAASQPGDVILLAAGSYPGGVVVPEDKPGITIRGVDRTAVVFDGEDRVDTAIEIEADDVTLENMTAHSYVENGFYWEGVDGFAGRYLTVWNVGLYGIYAIESRDGVLEDSYVSGAADAAFYIGECHPCDATLRRLTATLSAVGYSGTNAGGNLVVEDSVFDSNGVGILPNSYDVGLEPPPQREAIFRRNVVRGSGSVPTPRQTPLGGFYGIGIGIVGGIDNLVEGNEVTGSARYGVAVVPSVDRNTTFAVSGNRVVGNRVSGSGIADLALAAESGAGNCFDGNVAIVLDPPTLTGCQPTGSGSVAVASALAKSPPELEAGLLDAPRYTEMPEPPAQPTMAAATEAPLDGIDPSSLVIVGAALAAAGMGAAVLVLRRR